jgi:hypothetical protein
MRSKRGAGRSSRAPIPSATPQWAGASPCNWSLARQINTQIRFAYRAEADVKLGDEVDGKQPALGIELRIGPAVPHAAHLIPRIEFTRCIRTDDKRRLCDRDLPAFARQVSFTLDTSPRRSLPCAAGVPGAIMAVFRQNLGLTQDSQSRAIPCCAVPRLGRVTW